MSHKTAIVYGLLIWLFVFAVSLVAVPLRATERPLFESIMPVALALATTYASVKYFQKTKKRTAMVGLCLGLIWLAVNVTIDACLFSWGPMKMSLNDYLKDIFVTYLMFPIITTGFGAYSK